MDDVFPKRDADFAAWYSSFHKGITNLTGVLPNVLTVDVVDQVSANADVVRGAVNHMVALSNYAGAIAEYKAQLFGDDPDAPLGAPPVPPSAITIPPGAIAGVKPWTRALIRRIKADPAYNVSIGEGLGIVAVRRERQDPSLQVRRVLDSTVELRVRRGGYTAVAIESRRGGGSWELIGYSTIQQFFDARPSLVPGQAERREYRAQGIHRNVRTGGVSDIVGTWTAPSG